MARKVVGPTGSRRRRWLFLSCLVAVMAAAAFFISAAGAVPGSPSNFESADGNMIVDTTGYHDWANVNFTHVVDLASSTSDDSFVSGQKQDTTCPDTYGHGNPPKDDFTDVASYSETNNNSASPYYHHTYLYGATIRYAANGNASENVELKQGKNGTCTNGLLARTLADKLIAIDYLNGGTDVQFHVLTWIVDSSGYDPTPGTNPDDDIAGTCNVSSDLPPCWSSTVTTLTSSAADGKANQEEICVTETRANGPCPPGSGADPANDPIAGDTSNGTSAENGKNLDPGQFAEFGVDLTAAGIIPANTCTAFPQTIWESRASGSSFVSTTKDISVEDHTISNCGEIKIIKQTNPRGLDQVFSFSSGTVAGTNKLNTNSSAGGVACTAGGTAGVHSDGSFCLNDTGNSGKTLGSPAAAQNSTGNTIDENNLFAGTYTVTEGANPTGFAFDSVTCTVNGTTTTLNTVADPKTVTINLGVNDVVVCVYQNNQQLGAIKLTKTSSKAAATALAGAYFRVCTNGTDGGDFSSCTAAKTGSDNLGPTNSSGEVCIDGLAFGDYYVSEKTAPSGYAIDDAKVHKITVSTNAKCSDATYVGQSMTFTDTPLTNLTITASSQATGGTKSAIECVDGNGADVGNSPKPTGVDVTDTSTYANPVTVTADQSNGGGLKPGTYTCTVYIDP